MFAPRAAFLLTLALAACATPAREEKSPPRATEVPRVAHSDDFAPEAGPQREAASSTPTTPSVAVDRKTAQGLANHAWQKLVSDKLVDSDKARVEPPTGEPQCEANVCSWQLAVGEPTGRALGNLWVDAQSGVVSWEPIEGRSQRWTLEEYAKYDRGRRRAVEAVTQLADVKRFCQRLRNKHGLDCIVYLDEGPESGASCKAKGSIDDPCLWTVYVGEVQPTHASRFATFYVDIESAKVVAASPLACDRMSLANWRSYEAALAKSPSKPPVCPNSP